MGSARLTVFCTLAFGRILVVGASFMYQNGGSLPWMSEDLIRRYLSIKKSGKILSCITCILFFFAGLVNEVKGAVILGSSLSVSEVYNDNLFFTEVDRQADFATNISSALSLAYTSRNLSLTVGYLGSAQFHAEHPEADGYFQSLSFNLDLPILNRQIRGVEIAVVEEVSYSPELPAFSFGGDEEDIDERLNQVFLAGEGVQQSGRVDTFRNRAGISARYPFWKNFSVHASYFNVITRYSGGGLEDSVVHIVNLGGDFTKSVRWPSKSTEWTASYDNSLSIFEGDVDLIHRLNLNVQHFFSRLVTARGSLGTALPEGESPQIILGAGISKRYKTGRLDLRYSSDVATGLGVIRGITRRQSIVGSATRALGQRVALSVNVGYASNRSFEEGDEAGVDILAYTAEIGLSMRLLSWLSGGLNYSYLDQQSKGLFGRDGERNVVSLTFTAAGPSYRIIK